MLTADIDKEHTQTVFDMLTELWITIRGIFICQLFSRDVQTGEEERIAAIKGLT